MEGVNLIFHNKYLCPVFKNVPPNGFIASALSLSLLTLPPPPTAAASGHHLCRFGLLWKALLRSLVCTLTSSLPALGRDGYAALLGVICDDL